MDQKEVIKIACLALVFGLGAPALGVVLKGRRLWQQAAFALMCFMTIGGGFWAADWGLTLQNVEHYRGHSRGYHFYFNEALALALVVAQVLERRSGFRWLPPGFWLYLVFCGVSFLSIFAATNPNYVCMAAFKAIKVLVIATATYNFLRTEKDLRFFLLVMCGTMGWQTIVVLAHKYYLHIYQIRGTFEHQNSLTMYTGLIGMLFLAASLGPKIPGSSLFLLSYIACAVIVESALSRGGLAAFVIGTAAMAGLSLLHPWTRHRLSILLILGLVALGGLAVSLDTIVERFGEKRTRYSKETRDLLKESAWEMLKDHPGGAGWNNFALLMSYPHRYGENLDRWTAERGHTVDPRIPKGLVESLYWLLLAETGPQSLLVFTLLISLFLWWNLKAGWYFRSEFLGFLSFGILTGCGINYLHSFYERNLVFERNQMLWIVMLAITAKIETWRRESVRASKMDLIDSVRSPVAAHVARRPGRVPPTAG